jgi:hypothetical protein
VDSLCGCSCVSDSNCYSKHTSFYYTCVYGNYYAWNSYAQVYATDYYKSSRGQTQRQLRYLSSMSSSLFGDLQHKYQKTTPLIALYYLLVSQTNVNKNQIDDNCQSILTFGSNLGQYISNSTSQFSAEQIKTLTDLHANLVKNTNTLCTGMTETADSCTKRKTYDRQTATNMANALTALQDILKTLTDLLNEIATNTYALTSGTQASYQLLASNYLNNTGDVSNVGEWVNQTRRYYVESFKAYSASWRNSRTFVNTLMSRSFSNTKDLGKYFDANIVPYTDSVITNATLIIDSVNVAVFDCNYNYQNSILVTINETMVKIILEVLGVSIAKHTVKYK